MGNGLYIAVSHWQIKIDPDQCVKLCYFSSETKASNKHGANDCRLRNYGLYPQYIISFTFCFQAFQRTVKSFDFGTGEAVLMVTDAHFDAGLSFIRDCYTIEEPINKILGLQWSDVMIEEWLSYFKLYLSIMLVNKTNGDIMGIRVTRIQKQDDTFLLDEYNDPKFKIMCEFTQHADEDADFFGTYQVTECFHFYGLAVHSNYRRQGIAEQLVRLSIRFLCNLGIDNVVIKGEGSSIFAQKIYEKCGFNILSESKLNDFKVNNVAPLHTKGLHCSQKGYGLHISGCNIEIEK